MFGEVVDIEVKQTYNMCISWEFCHLTSNVHIHAWRNTNCNGHKYRYLDFASLDNF